MNFKEEVARVYERLGDELSRKIFENRFLYYFTGNTKFSVDYILTLIPKLEDARIELKSILSLYGDIIVYGLGTGSRHIDILYGKDNVLAFCDSDTNKREMAIRKGYNVISPEDMVTKFGQATILVSAWRDNHIDEIVRFLLDSGFQKNQILIYRDILNNINPRLLEIATAYNQYFDAEIIKLTQDEVFIDAGCFDGTVSIEFAKRCNNQFLKIIAFEPNLKSNSNLCKHLQKINNVMVYPYGLWHEEAELCFENAEKFRGPTSRVVADLDDDALKIKAVKLDDILIKEAFAATFIKMDIEAAELNALKGAKQTILAHRPKLAISVYHKPEDIWQIPLYIISLHEDYDLRIRPYSLTGNEMVLYAV